MQVEVYDGVTVGTAVGLALAPAWLPRLRRFSGAVPFAALALLAIASGAWLTAVAATDHVVLPRYVVTWSALVVGLVVTVGVVLWARTVMRDASAAVLYGLGLAAGVALHGLAGDNAWKFSLSVPVTVLLLACAWRTGRRSLEVLAAVVLAGVSAVSDSRSHFAMMLLVAALVLGQAWWRTGRRGAASGARALVVVAVVAWGVYSLGQALLLDGRLGLEAQERSQEQVQATGSVLLGGRPEIGATAALMAHRPLGLGTGTSPSTEEVLVAKGGMMQLGYDPNNGYVERYMFGELVELHSITGDAWALFGIPGLALAGLVGWAALHRAGAGLAERALSGLMAFLVVRVVWDLLFGPLYSTLHVLALAVGLALLPRPAWAAGRGEQAIRSRPRPGPRNRR
jgi:hypothetical protein